MPGMTTREPKKRMCVCRHKRQTKQIARRTGLHPLVALRFYFMITIELTKDVRVVLEHVTHVESFPDFESSNGKTGMLFIYLVSGKVIELRGWDFKKLDEVVTKRMNQISLMQSGKPLMGIQ